MPGVLQALFNLLAMLVPLVKVRRFGKVTSDAATISNRNLRHVRKEPYKVQLRQFALHRIGLVGGKAVGVRGLKDLGITHFVMAAMTHHGNHDLILKPGLHKDGAKMEKVGWKARCWCNAVEEVELEKREGKKEGKKYDLDQGTAT
jgi:hypothetical protein